MNQSYCQWIRVAAPEGGPVTSLAESGGNILVGTNGGGGVYVLKNIGDSWTLTNTQKKGNYVYALSVCNNNVFAGDAYNGVSISTDYGVSWSNTGLSKYDITSLASSGNTIFAGTNNDGIYRSSDNGLSWTKVNDSLRVYAIAACENNIFAGATAGSPPYAMVILSQDNGTSWNQIVTGLHDYIFALAANNNNIYVVTDKDGIYRSTDNGTSWKISNTGLSSTYIHSINLSGNNIFAGTDSGVSLSKNEGESWTSVNTGFSSSMSVTALLVSGKYIFAGTTGSGVWRRPLSEMVSVSPHNQNNNQFLTENSFNSTIIPQFGITLHYRISRQCMVSIEMYTISGKKVVTFDRGYQLPGEYSFKIAKSQISSGTFVCHFQAGSNKCNSILHYNR